MAKKLYFRYGAMGSGKTLQLISVAYNYRDQGKKVIIAKPALENRDGQNKVVSRCGLEVSADWLLKPDTHIEQEFMEDLKGRVHCILVDEAQFLSPHVVEQLKDLTFDFDIPVICYGLLTDFRTKLFDGSKRLVELAETKEEVKTICWYCNKKAMFNMRYCKTTMTTADKGPHEVEVPVTDGELICLGANDKYRPVCYGCYPRESVYSKEN